MEQKESGKSTDHLYVRHWPYFKVFKFLVPVLTGFLPIHTFIRFRTHFQHSSHHFDSTIDS